MMKRYLLSIILGILSFANYSFGQIELNFVGATGNANGTVDVDVTVNGFTDMAGLQYSGAWDSLVMTYNSVVSTNPNLPALNTTNISGPEGAALDEGQFSFSYNNPNGTGNLDDGDVLFTLRFNLIGEECASTQLSVTNDPTTIEAFNKDFTELSVTATSGDIMINGSDCNGTGGGDELTITAGMETVGPGGTVCVPLVVTNFNAAQSGSGTILWDPTVITYNNLDNISITGVDNSLNTSNVSNGELKFVWSNVDPANPLTLADGSILFEICFTAIGSIGDMSPITLSEAGSLGFEFADDDGTAFPQVVTDGKVTIVGNSGPAFTLNVSDITANMNSVGCVDITVANFTNILSMQFALTWDTDIINNANPTSFMLGGISTNSFLLDQAGGSATFSWNDNVGVDLADNSKIFSLCFDAVGDCDEVSPVQIVSQGTTNIEIVDGNTNEVSNVDINQGSVTIGCNPDPCAITNTINTCAGMLGGSVTVNVADGCSYAWTNSSGAVIATTQNLLGVGVGVYQLNVTCNGVITCTLNAQVNEIAGPTVTGTETDASCGDLGAIDVMVAGGSGSYSYSWNPANTDSPNISNLPVGMYSLTVTDTGSGCTGTASFNIEDVETELLIGTADITDENCLEDNGAVVLNVSGGCMPYTYLWSNGATTSSITGVVAGVYGVTVEDAVSNMVTGSYTVGGFVELGIDGAPVVTPENLGMGDGSISIMILGGTEPYTYNWSGPTTGLPNSNVITGLSAGSYTVAVSDASGCDIILGPFTVLVAVDGEPMFTGVAPFDAGNGFGVVCNGDATGIISGGITGTTPFTITLGGTKDSVIIKNDQGTFVFDNLAAGTYTLSATNSVETTDAGTFVVAEPDEIIYNIEKGCVEEDQCDGFIDLNASGGFGELTYSWSDPNLDGDSVDDLCVASYTITIRDENGCEKMEIIDVIPCVTPIPSGCYEVRNVITPNGDGMNETFDITCINDFPSTLEVYDRWGALVYNQEVYDGLWSGVSNSGDELIEGGYMYVIVIDFGQGNRQVMKGTITLLRD